MKKHKARSMIIGSGYYVPPGILTNDFFVNHNPFRVCIGITPEREPIFAEDTKTIDKEKIFSTTGIKERRRSAPDQYTSDLAAGAAIKAIADAQINPEDLEGIILTTVTPDTRVNVPPVSSVIKEKINASKVKHTMDVNAACSGFNDALAFADYMVKSTGGLYLVVGAETLTKIVDYSELNCNLFGDGAGACVLGPSADNRGILSAEFVSDTEEGKNSFIMQDRDGFLRMPNGHQVFRHGTKAMQKVAENLTERAGLSLGDIGVCIPHQANGRMLESLQKTLGIPVFNNIEYFGNTSSASEGIAYSQAREEGEIHNGEIIAFIGVGAGLTAGGIILRV